MKMILTEDEIRKDYEKRIMIFTLKNGKVPKRTKLFAYLFAIIDFTKFNPAHILLETGSKHEGYDRTANFSRFHLRHLRNVYMFEIKDALRKSNLLKYIGDYKLEYDQDRYLLNIHFVHKNIRWDLIDYDLKKTRPHLVRENKNSFHILKNQKWTLITVTDMLWNQKDLSLDYL